MPLVRETGRKATEAFVKNFLLASYDDATEMSVRVRFEDEATAAPSTRPVSIEGGPEKR